jgi:hypothetical protein
LRRSTAWYAKKTRGLFEKKESFACEKRVWRKDRKFPIEQEIKYNPKGQKNDV